MYYTLKIETRKNSDFFFYSDYSRVEDNLMFEHYNLESSGGGVFDLLLLENSWTHTQECEDLLSQDLYLLEIQFLPMIQQSFSRAH